MINDPEVSTLLSSAETQSEVVSGGRRFHLFGRATVATVLLLAAVATFALSSLLQDNGRATAQSRNTVPSAQSAPVAQASAPVAAATVTPFEFGYLVFEADPAGGGIHGFGPLPRRSPGQ